jgi:hypothetical protein
MSYHVDDVPTSNKARDTRPADWVMYEVSDDRVKLLMGSREMYAWQAVRDAGGGGGVC